MYLKSTARIAMKKQTIDLSIVIPALREAKRLPATFKEISNYIKKDKYFSGLKIEVIIVAADGGDNTVGVAQKWQDKIPNLVVLEPGKPVGKGRDVKVGMLAARGNAVLFMDADLATPLKYIPVVYEYWKASGGIVVGVRNLRQHHPNILRRLISNIGNLIFKLLCGVRIEDSQCGFKLFSKSAAVTCFRRVTILRWGFDMEVLTIAKKYNININQIMINDWQHKSGGHIDNNTITQSVDSLRDLIKIFINRMSGHYNNRISEADTKVG